MERIKIVISALFCVLLLVVSMFSGAQVFVLIESGSDANNDCDATEDYTLVKNNFVLDQDNKGELPAPPENLKVHHYDFLGEMGDHDFEVWETTLDGDDLNVYYPTGEATDGYPALAFGHGAAQDPEDFESWGEHYASRGFVAALPDLGTFYDDSWPAGLLSTLEFLKDENEEPGSPIEGKIAEDKMGLTGFSAGAEAAIYAAEEDALEGDNMVKALAAMAPSIYSDDWLLSSVEVDPENLEVPIQLQVGNLDEVTPEEDVSEFYDDLEASDEPSQFFVIDGANHGQYGDEDPWISPGEPEISREEQQRIARKYTTSFFNYYLNDIEKYGEYPFGAFIEEDVEKGILDSNDYRNVDYVTPDEITGFEHNKILWSPSPDDPDIVESYNIYRSEEPGGPWDEPIGEVDAEGSDLYGFVDENKGDADDIYWWYVVRAENEQGEEDNTDAVQEPGGEPGPLLPSEPEPQDGAAGISLDAELSVLVEHEEGEDMDVSFYDASDDSLIGSDEEIPSGERAYTSWAGLDQETTYEWYAVSEDGVRTARSPTWSFTTVSGELLPPTELRIEKDEEAGDLILNWDDVGAAEYNLYYSEDQYADFGDWEELATVEGSFHTHEGVLGGENYYFVRSTDGEVEGEPSEIAFCVERNFEDTGTIHYVSIPMGLDATGDGELRASDIVISIEGDLMTNDHISEVVKWDHLSRGHDEIYYFDDDVDEWKDDFVIESGDGIGLYVENEFTWHINATDVEHEVTYGDERPRHYTSIPYTLADQTGNGELRASDLVMMIEGDLESSDYIFDVVKWDASVSGYNERYYYDALAEEWTDDFVIEPGDGIGLAVQNEFTLEFELIMQSGEAEDMLETPCQPPTLFQHPIYHRFSALDHVETSEIFIKEKIFLSKFLNNQNQLEV